MQRHLPKLIVWSLLAGAVWWLWPAGELRHEPGVRLDREPMQQMIAPQPVGSFKKYTITAVAAYAIEARVLRTKRYWADGEDLVPYDVAVGWGAMSDQAVLDRLSISQGNRFFFYEWQNPPPIPVGEIERHAANMHVIAANKEVAKAVKRLRRGEFVAMRGYLVNVGGPDGFYWNTSLRRDDTGNGACEVFYVESVEAKPEPALLAHAESPAFRQRHQAAVSQ
jgi:hypothetical protein